MAIPVEIKGHDSQGEAFAEKTKTVKISPAYGALVLLSAPVQKGCASAC